MVTHSKGRTDKKDSLEVTKEVTAPLLPGKLFYD